MVVMICCLGGPRNSSFMRCSRIQMTTPTTIKKMPVTHHSLAVNGLRNAHVPEFSLLTGATTTSPDSVNGWVKSAIRVRLVMIAMSPTAASKTYIYH